MAVRGKRSILEESVSGSRAAIAVERVQKGVLGTSRLFEIACLGTDIHCESYFGPLLNSGVSGRHSRSTFILSCLLNLFWSWSTPKISSLSQPVDFYHTL